MKKENKKGVILYVTGTDSFKIHENPGEVSKLDLRADRVEVVDSQSGYSDIHPAFWRLIVDGVKMVDCIAATYTDSGALNLVGQEMRLYG